MSFGIGGAIDVVLTKTLENIQEERAGAFFDELVVGNIVVDEDLLKSEDFLHAYYATTKFDAFVKSLSFPHKRESIEG